MYIGVGYILPTNGRYIFNNGVFVRPSDAGLQIVYFCLKKAYFATLHPPIDIYLPIVGRIYPITMYKFNLHIFPDC